MRQFFSLLSRFWFMPFGFYSPALRGSRVFPHPLAPRNLRDLILNKMMFPDNILRAVVADKLATRGWVAEQVGEEYLIPLLDVVARPQDLKKAEYPLPVVIKSNHASGQVAFVETLADYEGLDKKARKWLSKGYNLKREWVYRDIDRCLMVEEMLLDEQGRLPADIKFDCYFGEPALVVNTQTVNGTDRFGKTVKHYMTPEWERMDINPGVNSDTPLPEKPHNYPEMLEVVRKLSAPFDYIRVDLFYCRGRLYVGEVTNFDDGGGFVHSPPEKDAALLALYRKRKADRIATLRKTYGNAGRNTGQ